MRAAQRDTRSGEAPSPPAALTPHPPCPLARGNGAWPSLQSLTALNEVHHRGETDSGEIMTQEASQEKLLYTEGRLGDLMKPVPRERQAQGTVPLPGQRRASRERLRVDPSGPAEGGEGGGNGCPHYTDLGRHPHPLAFPPNPPPAPSLCKWRDYTDLHNSCIISMCSWQAFRLHKAILLSLTENRSQWERFSVLFSLNTKTV